MKEKRNIKKIVLAIPNFRWGSWEVQTLWNVVPYNLCLLAAVLEGRYDVSIVDANIDDLSRDAFKEIIEKENPDLVGVSVLMDQYGKCGHLAAETVKSVDKNIVVVMGGVYATMNFGDVIRDVNIDYVIRGEGEYVFPELLGSFSKGNPFPEKGIVYMEHGNVIAQPRADFITRLDDLPLPAYHKIDFLKYANTIPRTSIDAPEILPYARMFTSRGCPVGCVFCQVESIAGKKFRYRSAQNVLREMKWLKETYGIKSLIFDDDNLLTNKERAKEIFRGMIREKFDFSFKMISVAVFCLDEELLELMKESGCCYIDIAIESGVQRVLKDIVKKPLDYDYTRKMIRKAKELDIYICANFMVGFPGETWEEIRETIKFAEDLDVDYVKIFATIPLRNTRLYEIAKEGGYLKEDFNRENISWYQGQIKTGEFTPRDLSILRAYEWDRINFTDPVKRRKTAEMMGISVEELKDIRMNTLRGLKL